MRGWGRSLALCLAALALAAMAGSPPRAVSVALAADESWPVIALVELGDARVGPEPTFCCLGRGTPGGSGTTVIEIAPGTGAVAVRATWLEIATGRTYSAALDLPAGESRTEIAFRPHGAIALLVPGPALKAAMPEGPIRNAQEMRDALTAPGLGRAVTLSDYKTAAAVCGAVQARPDWLSEPAKYLPPRQADRLGRKPAETPPSFCEAPE